MPKKSESVKFDFAPNPSLPNGTMTKDEMLLEVQLEVEAQLGKIERIYKRWNLHFDRLTLIARVTENDNKMIVLTNEDHAGLEKACALAIAQQHRNIHASQVETTDHSG